MTARFLATATLLTAFSPALPAVDSQLLNLVMPDAKVLAGVNVAQAKASPFGQFVLSQMTANDPQIQDLVSMTGFDPRRDVNEMLAVSNGAPGAAGMHAGLVAATGTFDVNSIVNFAKAHGGSTETYGGVTILEDPKQTHGFAFFSGSLVAAGDVATVKAAIDRQSNPAILPSAVLTQLNQLSGSEDAWALSTGPITALNSNLPGAPNGVQKGLQTSLGSVQSMSGGVKFGATVNFTAQLQTDTAQNATALAGVIQFLSNMAQLQDASKNPQAAAALQSLTVTASGNSVTVALNLPEDQFQQLLHPQVVARPNRQNRK
jgi:hypothetical protein